MLFWANIPSLGPKEYNQVIFVYVSCGIIGLSFSETTIMVSVTKSSQVANFRTIGDICYQYQAGFHKIQELVELTSYPGAQKFVTALIQSLPPKPSNNPPPPPPTKKTFFHIQNDDDLDDRVIYTHWDRLLGPINWRKVFLYKYQNHIDKRITDVQYKHIHGKLAPHLTLYYSKIQASALCTRCREFPEELRHFFLDCPRSQRKWKIVTYHLFIITSKPPSLKRKNL